MQLLFSFVIFRAVPRIFCMRGQTPQTFTRISRIQTGFLVGRFVSISFPGGGNCPPAPPLCTALINASVGILPIEKYMQLLKFGPQTLLISQVLRRFLSLHEEGMTVKLSMRIIQSNPSQTHDVFNSKLMSKYRMKNKIKFFAKCFSLLQIPKTV